MFLSLGGLPIRRAILLIGAFERDNFGDFLFALVTRSYLKAFDVSYASTLASALPSGEPVESIPGALQRRSWDSVWVTGGEVGGVDVETALHMALSGERGHAYRDAAQAGRGFIARALGHSSLDESAYLPPLARYPKNASTPLVVNSVGLSRIASFPESPLCAAQLGIVGQATEVAVRDRSSQDFLQSRGIPSMLSPDIVHSISARGDIQMPKQMSEHAPYIAVQINTEVLRIHGVRTVSAALVAVARESRLRIRLHAAGTAPGHDSLAALAAIGAVMSDDLGPQQVRVETERDPLAITAMIARSNLWIGSSLHGRIVASSYGVPRVSLENAKVSGYAETWDPEYPHGVAPEDLSQALGRSFALAEDRSEAERSRDLLERAQSNARRMAEVVG